MTFHLGLCPWGHLLKFRDEQLEANFMTYITQAWSRFDLLAGAMVVVMFPIKLLQGDPIGLSYYVATFLAWLCIPLTILYLHIKHHEFYMRNRLAIVSFFRFLIPMGCMVVVLLEDVWTNQDPGQLFARLITRSTIMDLLMSTLGLRVPFQHHIALHFLGATFSSGWIMGLQQACMSDPDVRSSIKAIEGKMELVVSMISMIGNPGEKLASGGSLYPCVFLALYFQLTVGYVFPSALLYVTEVWSRAAYLESLAPNDQASRKMIRGYKISSIFKAVLVVPVIMVVCWFGVDAGILMVTKVAEFEGVESLLPLIGWSCCLVIPLFLSWFGFGSRMPESS
ncbi:hypothetical protein BSKO_04411 [Bryopsis sp. KO-2023]|nr:hypothetical protein BSKO_04411 [Bryopsis sp. KO-2023]